MNTKVNNYMEIEELFQQAGVTYTEEGNDYFECHYIEIKNFDLEALELPCQPAFAEVTEAMEAAKAIIPMAHKALLDNGVKDTSVFIKVVTRTAYIEDNAIYSYEDLDVAIFTGAFNVLPKRVNVPYNTSNFFEYVEKDAA